jgi:hypothetical protein
MPMLIVHIHVRERIDLRWAEWFSGLAIEHADDGGSTLAGRLADQSALYGVLSKMRDLGLSLSSLSCELGETGLTGEPSPGSCESASGVRREENRYDGSDS